jgi:hypothetical protein
MSKHTPGPFRVASFGEEDGKPTWFRDNNGDWVITSEKGRVGTATFSNDDIPARKRYGADDPEGLANARLFAAAPTMLEALQNIEAICKPGVTHDIHSAIDAMCDVWNAARAAIALAEGE